MKKTIYSINELERYCDDILHAAGLLHHDGYGFDTAMYDEIAFRLELDWLVPPADWEAYMGVTCRLGALMYKVDELMLRVQREQDGLDTTLQDALGDDTIDGFKEMLEDYQYGW